VSAPGPATSRRRLTIDERAERREQVERGGSDRYTSLMRALYAGQEVPLRRRRAKSMEWHPIAGKLILVAIIAVLAYAAVSIGYNAWRDASVDTWSGPDASVMSGQRLADCPLVNALHDDTFPTWVRFEAKVYRLTGVARPVGSRPTPDYPATGYELGQLRLHRIANTPDGLAGQIVLLKLADAGVGQVFELTEGCE
jgi:hypothetical protein